MTKISRASLSNSTKDRSGLVLIFGLGGGLLLTHVAHALGEDDNVQAVLFGIAVPVVFAVGVIAGGIWLWRRADDDSALLRIGVWCWVGAVVLGTGGLFTILYQQAEGVMMSHGTFVVINGASAGAAIGFVTGVYDSRQRTARSESYRLNRQLTVLNRVLRHDIRNSANVIRGNAERLAEAGVDGTETARIIQQEADDLVELSEHAKDIEYMLHSDDAEREVTDLVPLVEGCRDCVHRDYPNADISVALPERQLVHAHPLIDSAVTNLIENAVKHNDERAPRVDIESERLFRNETEYTELRIADNGPGIPDDEIAVLERGYETTLEHASGLGLWLVDWIVRISDGTIRFDENDPEGTVVGLRLETAEASTTPASDSNGVRVHDEPSRSRES